MQFSLLALSAALVGLVSAQTIQTLPSCATGCVDTLLPKSCNLNPSCICADNNFITNISCCIFNACPTSDQQAALAYAKTYCTPVGVTLPAQAGCSNSTSSSATTSRASTAVSSASSAASAAASSATSRAAAGERTAAQGLGLVGAIIGAVALL